MKHKNKASRSEVKTYYVDEVITSTIKYSYKIEASSKEEALEKFRMDGEYIGDCSTADKEGVQVREAGK